MYTINIYYQIADPNFSSSKTHCYQFNYEPTVIYLPHICPYITTIYKVYPPCIAQYAGGTPCKCFKAYPLRIR